MSRTIQWIVDVHRVEIVDGHEVQRDSCSHGVTNEQLRLAVVGGRSLIMQTACTAFEGVVDLIKKRSRARS